MPLPTQPWPGEKLANWGPWSSKSTTWWPDLYNIQYGLDPAGDPEITVPMDVGDAVFIFADAAFSLRAGDVIGPCNWIISPQEAMSVSVTFGLGDSDYDTVTWGEGVTVSLEPGRNFVPLPLEYRTMAVLRDADPGYPCIRIQAETAGVLTDGYLQIEPPGGLQQISGTTWSDWFTSEVLVKRPCTSSSQTEWSKTGYSSWVTIGTDVEVIPDAETLLAEAYGNAFGALPVVTARYGGILAVGAGIEVFWESPNLNDPVESDFRMAVGLQRSAMTYDFVVDPTFRTMPGDFVAQGLKANRDYVSYEFDPSGETTPVAWEDSFVGARSSYLQDTFKPSPQGDSYSASGTGRSVGASTESSSPTGRMPASFVTPYTHPPGPITWEATSSWHDGIKSVVAPDGWGTGGPQYDSVRARATFSAMRVYSSEEYTSSQIDIWSRLPNFRIAIPIFVPSPDAAPAPEPEFDDTDVAPGYLINPNPNLDGEFLGVAVRFSGS